MEDAKPRLIIAVLFLATLAFVGCQGEPKEDDVNGAHPPTPPPASFTGEHWEDRTDSDCRRGQGHQGFYVSEPILEWGPRGNHLLFDDGAGNSPGTKLLVVDKEGGRVRTVVVANDGHIFQYGFHASVSQANGDILYSSCEFATQPLVALQELHWTRGYERGTLIEPRSLYGYELVAVGFDGANRERLTNTYQREHWAVWSPDGKRFAYVEDNDAVMVGEKGSRARRLSSSGVGDRRQVTGPPRWSPDNSKVLFVRGATLHIVDLETNERVRIDAPEGGFVEEGSFSPDGSHIVWAEAGEAGHVVYVGPVDGSSKEEIAEFPSVEFPRGRLRELHWSPAGPLILFHFSHDDESRGRAQSLYVVNQDGTDLRKVRGSSAWGGDYLVRWSPDGARIAIRTGGGVITMASDGTDRRVLAVLGESARPDERHAFVAANPRPPHPPVEPAACSNRIVIQDPEANPGLVADCEALLTARDWVAEGVFLDWHERLPMAAWEGVTVAGQPARVTEVVLRGIGLKGRMPGSFGRLEHLERLDLWHNDIRGQIPREFGDLTKLRSLDLSYNLIVGAIPPELGRLTNLEFLDLSHNQLSGPLPGELGALVDLRVLKLQDNNVGGAFPAELGNLGKLEELRLSRNRNLEGCVPDTLRAVEAVGTLLQRCWPDEDE